MSVKVIIVGGGRVGARLASLLINNGHSITIIEKRQEQVVRLRQLLPEESVVFGSGTDPLVLENAQVRQSDVLAAVTGTDETNLVATSLGRFEFAVRRTIARVKDPHNSWMFTEVMGVDVAVNQADLMAHLIAEEMSLDQMLTLLKFTRGHFSLVEEKVDQHSAAAGKAVRELDLPEQCLLTGIIRSDEFLLPRGNTVLHAGDEILAVVHENALHQVARILGAAST